MTDSVNVFPSGMRMTDNDTGAPIEGAVIYFYDAGTTDPRTVYSDANLSIPIGTSVTTDALGYPTTDGTTKTLIYTGTSDYKVVIKDGAGVTIATHDYVKGAIQTFDPTSITITASNPIVEKSSAYTILTTDQNKIILGNCSSASFTLTLPSAITAGVGWGITVQHTGSANTLTVQSAAGTNQTISFGSSSLGTSTDIRFTGEQITFVSDGGNWRAAPKIEQPIPAGTMMMHAANAAPTGWLKCNGAAISRTTYAALFASIGTTFGTGNGSTTFNVPDMRGYFARGWDDARGIDTGRTFGSTQTDVFTSHTHNMSQQLCPSGFGLQGTGGGAQYGGQVYINGGSTTSGAPNSGSGSETRPKNIAVLYIIKY